MRLIDADGLKRKVQKEATESWKMKIKASVETILNQVIDWIDEAQTIETQQWIPDGCHNCTHNPRHGGDGKCSCICPKYDCEPQWIPVKMRPMDSEEREYWEEHAGFTLTDDMAETFDCPMPDDGQRIWVQTKNGFVFDDVCDSDCDGIGLEGNGDWDDIVAWMPMIVPEPWKGESDERI